MSAKFSPPWIGQTQSGQCRSTTKIFQTVSGKSLAKQSPRQSLAICEAREIQSLTLGRNFGGGAFDEIGGTEPPELSKLVASDFSSSRHALQGLGVNPQKRCGLFCVDQRLKTRITGCRDPSGWFLSEVHSESPVMGGPIRANPSSLASSNVGILSNDYCALRYSSQE